jgi:hypothetical protein
MAAGNVLTVNGDFGGAGILKLGTSSTGTARQIKLTGNWSFNGTSDTIRTIVTFTGSGNQTINGLISSGVHASYPSLVIDKSGGSVTLQNSINMPVFTLTAGTFDAGTYMVTNTSCTLTAGTLKLGAATRAGNLQTFATPVSTAIEYYNANPAIDGSVVYQNLTFSGSGTAGASAPLTIQGTLANTGGGTLNFGANDVTLSGAVSANNIDGFTTSGTVSLTKTAGTATFTGNVNGSGLTINGSAGTLNLGTELTHTLSGNWIRTAGTLNGGSSTLKIGGSVSGTGGTFTPNTGTVEWNAAGPQSIAVLAYNNLSLSGSGVKTVASGTSVSGNLSIAPTGSATASLASGLNFNVDTLMLGGVGRINGTWGSTTATSATYQDNTYFDATTGYLTVTTSTAPADSTAPTPNPMTFALVPAATGPYSIIMTATTATDVSGVEYFFTCTAGVGGHDSGWTNSTTYTDTGLTPNTLYTYTVMARDKSPAQNMTAASTGASATTTDASDSTPPTPDPMTFASVPAATGPYSITMTATNATDPSGVEYFFTCTGGGGHDSGWTNSTTYVDTGLTPSTLYTYTVTARDKAPVQNTTTPSTGASATTDTDTTAPTPNPMTFASVPTATGPFSISMTATNASDPSDVEYFFTCTGGGGHDSGWTNSTTYVDTGLTTNTTYTYTVTARDKSPAQNATLASGGASATTLGLAATWDGSAGDQLWLTTANWTPAYVPNNVGAKVLFDRTQILPAPPTGTYSINLGPSSTVITVGQIEMETDGTVRFDINKTTSGTLVFDNNGANAIWNVETIGASKQTLTVVGTADILLSDNLVFTSRSTGQIRPAGTVTNAPGESHSITYISDIGVANQGFKLAWTARNTGGTIVDAGQIRGDTGSLDSRIGIAASGPDILLKNGGQIFVGENISHTLSRSVEIGSGGGKFVSDAGDSLTFSGVISGAGDLTVSKTGTALATVDLIGTGTNTLTGNVVLLSPQTIVGQELLVVADKVGAFGQTPLLTVGTNVIVRITANAGSGEGAIDDDATQVRLMNATSVFDVATGINEKLGKHKLQRFNGTTFDTIAAGVYSSNTVSWVTGGGTVTVDTGPIGTRISFF